LLIRYYKPFDTLSSDIDLYTSSYNGGYVFHENIEVDAGYDNQFYREYVAVDLGDRHILETIRNYGDDPNKLFINLDNYVEYSNTESALIEDVVWATPPPVLVINAEQDTVQDYVKPERTINLSSASIVTTDALKVFGTQSVYSPSQVLSIPYASDPEIDNTFFEADFTIHWWEYRLSNSTGSSYGGPWGSTSVNWGVFEGGVGGGQSAVRLCKYTGEEADLRAEFYNDSGLIGLISMGPPTLSVWDHYAFTRKNDKYYGFRNGILMGSFVSSSPPKSGDGDNTLYLFGKDGYFSGTAHYASFFNGYFDEFTLVRSACLWTHSFTPPTSPYSKEVAPVSALDVRWLKVVLNTGASYQTIDKLGVYPDISYPFCHGGGYNCSWTPLGTKLTDYSSQEFNVAEGILTISGSSTVEIDMGDQTVTWGAYKAVNGDLTDGYSNCWGFLGDDPLPTLEMDLGDTYNINRIVIHHGDSYDSGFMNNDYELFYKNDAVPDYTKLLLHFNSVSGTDSSQYAHQVNYIGDTTQISGTFGEGVSFQNDGYMSIPASDDWYFGEEEFTIDFRWYPISTATQGFIGQVQGPDDKWYFYWSSNNNFYFYAEDNNVVKSNVSFSYTPVIDTWYHIALVIENSVVSLYVDGVALTPTISTAHSLVPQLDAVLNIGRCYTTSWQYSTCGFDEVRVSKGVARWNSGFYPPRTEYTGEEISYKRLLTAEGNSAHITTHNFDIVEARYIKMVINAFTAPTDAYYHVAYNDETVLIDGGFIKEIQVFTAAGGGEVTSEDWPVVCVDLLDKFNITSHSLSNNHWFQPYGVYSKAYMIDTWDNSEEFYSYSDSIFEEPQKVTFSPLSGSGQLLVFNTSDDYNNVEGSNEGHIFGTVYLEVGPYDVTWKSINVRYPDLLVLRLYSTDSIIDIPPETYNTGEVTHTTTIAIETPGYYTIKSEILKDEHDEIGAGTISIQRITNNSIKWIALKRDTATDYAWTNDPADEGIDYLDLIKVFGDQKYIPTEYYWWWTSTLSTLSNDALLTKVNSRSLRIDYPASSEHDEVKIIEADSFGLDTNWSEMDLLSFWLYISDIDAFDSDWGGVAFGTIVDREDVVFGYYQWDFRNMTLVSGWNEIKLRFDSFDFTNPIPTANDYLHSNLNLRYRDTSSFHMVYRGTGTAFNMCIDDLKIIRNYFEDDVRFGKGLCLTWGESLDVPVADMSPNHGSIEFWAKLYCDNEGTDVFQDVVSRNFFSLVNNNNEMLSVGIRSGSWFEVGVGGAQSDFSLIVMGSTKIIPSRYYINYKETVHVGLVWSNDGSRMSAGETLRLYINGDLIVSSAHQWAVEDSKSVMLRLGGGTSVLAYNNDTDGSAIFDNIKAYNYCKEDGFDINKENVVFDNYITPNHFLELSQDEVTFYSLDDGVLPFTFSGVPPGETRTVYIRTNKDDRAKSVRKTGAVEIGWITTV
jgi:hypothetical protein